MINVLMIAYYFEPFKGVGAKRISYWAKNIVDLNKDISCDVITATPQTTSSDKIRNLFYVPNTMKSILKYLIKDQGLGWAKDLKKFFRENKGTLKYDFVIITGGPFMHFGISKCLRKVFRCKVILDFRDPFANNPIFKTSLIKRLIKWMFEGRFIRNADYIIAVNSFLLKLLNTGKNLTNKFVIIENGYDNTIKVDVKKQKRQKKISMVYAGTFCGDIDPTMFLGIITAQQFKNVFSFHHVGEKSGYLEDFSRLDNISSYGMINHKDTQEIINSCDIGLVFTGGNELDAPTKIFDYIGLKKPVLIVTDGEVKVGALEEITRGYPWTFWVENSREEIIKMLRDLKNTNFGDYDFDNYRFSRRAGLEKLVTLLKRCK